MPQPPSEVEKSRKTGFARLLAPFTDLFGLTRPVAVGTVALIGLILVFAVFWFFHLAPPKTITITSGTDGSSFQTFAERYRTILARNGVNLKILPSHGSLENLQRLYDTSFHVDIGFVQGGVTNGPNSIKLVSLGSVSYEPLLVFYRGDRPVSLLSDLKGKRLAIGPVGSGTHTFAMTLLGLSGMATNGGTTLVDVEAGEAGKALLEGEVDGVFLMGDSAPPALMKQLLLNPEIHILDFSQADAYTRRISYLNKLVLPKGALDFGKNIPPQDVHLFGPTVEILARKDFHPALCDLLLEAAREVHGGASLLKRKGEFPAPLENEFPISSEAVRYYKSGKSFLYRSLPFWLASLVNRVLVVFVPMFVVLIPAFKFIPSLFQWRIKLHFYRWYRALLLLEHDLLGPLTPPKRAELLARLDEIEKGVSRMKVPASFADQFYGLRGSIDFVRERLEEGSSKPQ